METYAIANQKGGVGKTTVTLGLAGELARRDVSTLLVDLDPQASATKVLGVDVDERPTIADALLEPNRFAVEDALVTTHWGSISSPPRRRSRPENRAEPPRTSSFSRASWSRLPPTTRFSSTARRASGS